MYRRRASRVRGIIRQLVSPDRGHAEILGERVLEDGQVLLRYQVEELGYSDPDVVLAVNGERMV